jgi:hypothetical protein
MAATIGGGPQMRIFISGAGAGSLSYSTVRKHNMRSRKLSYLDHVRSHEANTAVPLFRRVVEHVVHVEPAVLPRQRIQVLLEQNVLWVDIGKYQIHLCRIALSATPCDGLGDLQHRCDARSTGDHTKALDHVRRVHHGALGALDLHCLANHERSDMFGDVAGRVRFDEEVEIALVFVRGDGSVGSDDFLGLAGDGSGKGNVLADREAENVGGVGELEAVDGRIVRENRLLFQLELLELIGQ